MAYSALQIVSLPKIHLRFEFLSMLMRIFPPNWRAVTNDRTKSCRKAFFLFSFKCRYCAKSVTICLSKIPKWILSALLMFLRSKYSSVPNRRACTFIVFERKFSPVRLLYTARVLVFVLHVYLFWSARLMFFKNFRLFW